MKSCFVVGSLLGGLLLAPSGALLGFEGMPQCSMVEPDMAKAGDTVDVTCRNADKTTFAELYLTDGKNDTKVVIKEQSGAKIKFQVPNVKPGRYHLAFLTVNKASMIEQPVVLEVQ